MIGRNILRHDSARRYHGAGANPDPRQNRCIGSDRCATFYNHGPSMTAKLVNVKPGLVTDRPSVITDRHVWSDENIVAKQKPRTHRDVVANDATVSKSWSVKRRP